MCVCRGAGSLPKSPFFLLFIAFLGHFVVVQDPCPGKEVDYTSQLEAWRGPNYGEHSRNASSSSGGENTEWSSCVSKAWTGEFRPEPTGNERRITSLSRVPYPDRQPRILSEERPTMQMEIEDKGSHYACLS